MQPTPLRVAAERYRSSDVEVPPISIGVRGLDSGHPPEFFEKERARTPDRDATADPDADIDQMLVEIERGYTGG